MLQQCRNQILIDEHRASSNEIHPPCRFLVLWSSYAKQERLSLPLELSADHPIEELSRLFMAVLLKHTGEEYNAMSAAIPMDLSDPIKNFIKTIQQVKWTLIKTRQETGGSYKEVCFPAVERARFLLHELRPAIQAETILTAPCSSLRSRWTCAFDKVRNIQQDQEPRKVDIEVDWKTLMQSVQDFVLQTDSQLSDLEQLRKLYFKQTSLALTQQAGLERMVQLFSKKDYLLSTKYALHCGWQDLLKISRVSTSQCCPDLTLICPKQRRQIKNTCSSLFEWCLQELRKLLVECIGIDGVYGPSNRHATTSKLVSLDSATGWSLTSPAVFTRCRLLICLLSYLLQGVARHLDLFLSKNLTAHLLTLLRLLGPDPNGSFASQNVSLCAVMEESMRKSAKGSASTPVISGTQNASPETGFFEISSPVNTSSFYNRMEIFLCSSLRSQHCLKSEFALKDPNSPR